MHDTHIFDELAHALLDLSGAMNSPRQDDILIAEAKVSLDRALFPLLVRISIAKSIGVVELAAQVGRDHSTVSRQLAKLDELGLIVRRPGQIDQRVREAAATKAGLQMVSMITKARRRLVGQLLADWSASDIKMLVALNRRLADAMITAVREVR